MGENIKIPKWLNKGSPLRKYIVNPLSVLLTIYLSVSGTWTVITGDYAKISEIFTSLKKVNPNDFTAQIVKNVKDINDCVFDDSEWASGFGQLQKQGDGLYLLASTTQSSLLRYERSISSKSEIIFSFVPLLESFPNVVIVGHDLFEIVVGDESNRRVTVKANLIEGSSMSLISADNEDNKSFLLPYDLIIGKEVFVKIIQQPIFTNQHELILSITYDPKKDPVVKSYHFPIPPEFENSDKPIRVSIGIININNEKDTLIRFRCFKVSLNNSNLDLTYSKF